MRTDQELAKDLQTGDDIAFVSLYNRYKQPVHVFCVKMLGDTDAAKDSVQEVFLKIYEHRQQLTHPERFKSWMFSIARNQCLTYLRKSRNNVELTEDVCEEPLGVTELELREEAEMLNQSIATLRPEYREAIILREYQNLSYREIAEITESTESAVKSRLFKARRKLYEFLKPILIERG